MSSAIPKPTQRGAAFHVTPSSRCGAQGALAFGNLLHGFANHKTLCAIAVPERRLNPNHGNSNAPP